MANRVSSQITKAQARLLGAFQSSELRFRYPATYLALRAMSPIMFPNYSELRLREDRTVETNFATRAKRALGSARTHNHTGVKGDTATLTPSWVSYTDKFNMSLKQADASLYNADEQLFQEMSNIVGNFMEGYETAATAYLFANRSAVNIATSEGTFITAGTVNAFEIASANEARALQITKIAMDANKYPSGITIFCDSIAYAKFEYQAAQGISNATNLSFQFGGVKFIHSVELNALAVAVKAGHTKGYWLVVPDGTVATLPWIPKQNRTGVSTTVAQYSNILNPIDGETYALHTYETGADDSANNGYTQDVVTQYEVSQDLAFAKAPLSTAGETPILAFAII